MIVKARDAGQTAAWADSPGLSHLILKWINFRKDLRQTKNVQCFLKSSLMMSGISRENKKPRSYCWSNQGNQSRGNDITHTRRHTQTYTHTVETETRKATQASALVRDWQPKSLNLLSDMHWTQFLSSSVLCACVNASVRVRPPQFLLTFSAWPRAPYYSVCRNPGEVDVWTQQRNPRWIYRERVGRLMTLLTHDKDSKLQVKSVFSFLRIVPAGQVLKRLYCQTLDFATA